MTSNAGYLLSILRIPDTRDRGMMVVEW